MVITFVICFVRSAVRKIILMTILGTVDHKSYTKGVVYNGGKWKG